MKSISKKVKNPTGINQGQRTTFMKKGGQNKRNKKKGQGGSQNGTTAVKTKSSKNCYFCNKPGHIMKECEKLQKLKKAEKEIEL